MKLGLCLAGGGAKGIAHVGAIKALEEANIKFDYISGTSSGSIVATLYASGYTTDEIYEIFKKYAKKITYIDSKNICKFFGDALKGNFKIDGLNSGEAIYKLINKLCNQKGIYNINQVKMPLLIPSVDIYNEDLYIFYSRNVKNISSPQNIKYVNDVNIGTAVQASCSYPGIFSPCNKYKNTLLIDGGIEENVPWRETKRVGADKVLSIVFVNETPKKCCKNILEVLEKSFEILCHELSRYEWDGTDYLIEIKHDNIGLLDIKKLDEFYNSGYIQTKKYIHMVNLGC